MGFSCVCLLGLRRSAVLWREVNPHCQSLQQSGRAQADACSPTSVPPELEGRAPSSRHSEGDPRVSPSRSRPQFRRVFTSMGSGRPDLWEYTFPAF